MLLSELVNAFAAALGFVFQSLLRTLEGEGFAVPDRPLRELVIGADGTIDAYWAEPIVLHGDGTVEWAL